jgi:hypothetical protein
VVIIAHINPCALHAYESVSTLRFVSLVKTFKTRCVKNERFTAGAVKSEQELQQAVSLSSAEPPAPTGKSEQELAELATLEAERDTHPPSTPYESEEAEKERERECVRAEERDKAVIPSNLILTTSQISQFLFYICLSFLVCSFFMLYGSDTLVPGIVDDQDGGMQGAQGGEEKEEWRGGKAGDIPKWRGGRAVDIPCSKFDFYDCHSHSYFAFADCVEARDKCNTYDP